jgi:hypothetical protein
LVLGNLELALRDEPRPGAERKLTGKEDPADGDGLLEPTGGLRPLDLGPVAGALVELTGHKSISR